MAGILTRGGTILGTARDKPFKNPVPDADTGLLPIEAIKKNYKKWKMDALVVLGGNGTNTTGSLLFEEGLNVVGLPKTIDNDIVGTDITFGFHTAVDVAMPRLCHCGAIRYPSSSSTFPSYSRCSSPALPISIPETRSVTSHIPYP